MTEVTRQKLATTKEFKENGLSIKKACEKAGLSLATYGYYAYGPFRKKPKDQSPPVVNHRDTRKPVAGVIKGDHIAVIFGRPAMIARMLSTAL